MNKSGATGTTARRGRFKSHLTSVKDYERFVCNNSYTIMLPRCASATALSDKRGRFSKLTGCVDIDNNRTINAFYEKYLF